MQEKFQVMNLIQCKFSFKLPDGLTDFNAKLLQTNTYHYFRANDLNNLLR